MNNLEDYLILIEDEIDRGKPVRFTNKIAIDKNNILDILVDIRSNFPVEISRAKQVVADREDIIEEAEKQARSMVNEHEIYKKAVEQANTHLAESKSKVESWSLESVEFVDSVLENTSKALTSTIEKIEKNQQDSIKYFNDLNEIIYNNRKQLRDN